MHSIPLDECNGDDYDGVDHGDDLMLTMAIMKSCCDAMFDLILFSTYFDKCALYQLEPVI